MRSSVAVGLNLFVPGAGLIVLRREWLGVVLAALFGVCAQIGLWGLWIVPAAVPGWITVSALAGAVLVWIGAQYSLVARLREAFGPGIERELAHLCALAEQAMARTDYGPAEEFLEIALTLNDEDPRAYVLWAPLMTALGRFQRARQAWGRVLELTSDESARRQAREALAALP